MSWNFLAEITSALYLFVILIYSRRYSLFPSNRNRFFVKMIGVVFLTIVLSIISIFFTQEYTLIPSTVNHFIHTLFFLVYPWISVLFFHYTLYVIYEDREKKILRIQLITSVFILIYSILVLLNIRQGFIFTINQIEGYKAQPFEFIVFIVMYIYMILMVVYIELNRSVIESTLRVILLSYVVITSVFMTIQYFYPNLLLFGTAAGLSILIMYLYIQSKELVSDYLTRLPNNVAFEEVVKNRLKLSKQLNSIIICLRDFKNVNSMYGQKNGDILLKEITAYFVDLVGRVNVFRYSGDKFALLYFEEYYDSKELIETLYERFKHSWGVNDSLIYLESNLIHVNISDHVNNQFEATSLIDYLNEKVRSSNYRLPIYSSKDTFNEVTRKAMISEYIKKALKENLFEIAVQPIFTVNKDCYNHAEILLRLKHEKLGNISPAEVIPIAEESGLIIELGLWVLKQALLFLKKCDEDRIDIKTVSINFSVVQMNDANLIHDVKAVIDEYPQYAHKIVIEITESIFIADYKRIIEQMYSIKELGISFNLDDFGTGYSNILNVIKLPVNVIKIDKSLIYESIYHLANKKLIHGLCDAFSDAGLKVLAEGIENDEQYEIVRNMPIDYIQGYLFSRPLPPHDALNFLKQNKSSLN